MFKYIPDDFLGIIPMYWVLPIPNFPMWIGEFWNIWIILIIIYYLISWRKQKLYYKNWLIKKYATYLLSGKTGKWKTRLMAQIARDCKSSMTIISSNFFHEYGDLFFSSFEDFCRLERDIAVFWLHQNFSISEKIAIQKKFPWYFEIDEDTKKVIKKIKWKYDFLTLGDEFYAYLFNRNFMSNFAKGTGKQLLIDLHQTRHARQTLILASQNADSLDHDTRELAHNEIEVKSWLLDLVYWFDIQRYLNKYEQKTLGLEFQKVNKIPYLFFNFYLVWKSIDDFCKSFKRNLETFNFRWKKFRTNWIRTEWKLFEDSKLKYETNYNVRVDIDTYKEWDLFSYLLELEKKIK